MAQCEMCGKDVANPKTVKVEGAEIEVCDDCAQFGTEVKTQSSSSSNSKYSTSSASGTSGSSDSSSSSSSSGNSSKRRRRDMFDEMDELASDYDQRIKQAREAEGLSQEELAQEINEKASLIRKLEHGDMLPNSSVQRKLEKKLKITLTEASSGDEEWSGGGSSSGLTLGDMVKRKD